MTDNDTIIDMTVAIVTAAVGNPNFRGGGEEIAKLLQHTSGALHLLNAGLGELPAEEQPAAEAVPAVSVRKSLSSPDHIISLIDGKPYKTLRRHIARHGLTPESYRERFGLKADYPMVAPSYSDSRRAMAKRIGLGTAANRKGER